MKPLVSVVMNSYKEKPQYLVDAIESYLDQVGVDIELLISTVVDDPSVEIARRLGILDKHIVQFSSAGIYQQMNYAYPSATGEYIAYASSNDVAVYYKLATEHLACIESGKKVCYSSYLLFRKDFSDVAIKSFHPYDHDLHLRGNFVNDCSLVHRSLVEKYFPLRVDQWGNDCLYDFWLRIYEGEGDVFVYNPTPTWYYRQNPDSKHLSRKRDPSEMRKYAETRQAMLAQYRNIE